MKIGDPLQREQLGAQLLRGGVRYKNSGEVRGGGAESSGHRLCAAAVGVLGGGGEGEREGEGGG